MQPQLDGFDGSESTPIDAGFRGPQVCAIVGITYRQLDYWARTELVRPSIADAWGVARSARTRTPISCGSRS